MGRRGAGSIEINPLKVGNRGRGRRRCAVDHRLTQLIPARDWSGLCTTRGHATGETIRPGPRRGSWARRARRRRCGSSSGAGYVDPRTKPPIAARRGRSPRPRWLDARVRGSEGPAGRCRRSARGGGGPRESASDSSRIALGYLAGRRLGEQRCRFDVVGVSLDAAGRRHRRPAPPPRLRQRGLGTLTDTARIELQSGSRVSRSAAGGGGRTDRSPADRGTGCSSARPGTGSSTPRTRGRGGDARRPRRRRRRRCRP